MKKYITLFLSTLYISAFTFGGGYVIISLMQAKFCDKLKWLEKDEMIDLVAIAQSSPGAVAVNIAMLVGKQIAGVGGAIVSVIGTIIPPFVIISVISIFYDAFASNFYVAIALRAMQAGVSAVIASVVITLGSALLKTKNLLWVFMMIASFIITYFLKVNLIYVILGCGLIGILCFILERHSDKKKLPLQNTIEDKIEEENLEMIIEENIENAIKNDGENEEENL